MPFHSVKGINIRTDPTGGPAEMRWCAVDDDTYDGDGGLIGFGEDEQAAIDDLLHAIDESGEAEPEEFDHQTAKWDHDRDLRKHSW